MKLVGILFVTVLFMVSQEPMKSRDAHPQQESKIVRQERDKVVKQSGWVIPGFKEYVTLSSVHEKQFHGVDVSQNVFSAGARPVIDYDGNTVGSITAEGINVPLRVARGKKQVFDLRDFSRYDVNGHTFAYAITLVPLAIEKKMRTYAGAMYRLLYFDEDGDGRFETRYSGFTMPGIPEWAKNPSVNTEQ